VHFRDGFSENFVRTGVGPKGHSLCGLKVVYFQNAFNSKTPGPKGKALDH